MAKGDLIADELDKTLSQQSVIVSDHGTDVPVNGKKQKALGRPIRVSLCGIASLHFAHACVAVVGPESTPISGHSSTRADNGLPVVCGIAHTGAACLVNRAKLGDLTFLWL